MTDDDLHDLAVAAGAMVLGDEGTRQQYLLDLSQLRALLAPRRVVVPPCPVPLPKLK